MHFIIGRTVEDVHHDASAVLAHGMVKGPDLSNRDQCMSLLRRRYGNLTDELIRQSGQAFARLPEKVKRYLDSDRNGTGELLSNSPAVIAGLALWGAGFMRQTPEAAQKELDALSKSKTVDNYTKDRIAVLRHIVSRAAGSREHAGLKQALADKKAPKPVAKTAREKLEAELKQIRMDPGYYKRDAGNHKALVARVNAIYAELHPEGR